MNKKILFLFVGLLFINNASFSQVTDTGSWWMWMKGLNGLNQSGIYGTRGVPAPANVPGARGQNATWMDNAGNFWIFGGQGVDATGVGYYLNDMWKFDTTTKQWTWMGGPNTARQVGVYGTQGVAAATNIPGSRYQAMFWKDKSGNFWLFGGDGTGSVLGYGAMNDMWKYDVATNMWTWMGGVNGINTPGSYGTQNVAAATNLPPARKGGAFWTDANGIFWLFGGFNPGSLDRLNDLWKFDPATNMWTWVGGSQTVNNAGSYGTIGVTAPTNLPPARAYGAPATWQDAAGNVYLFGGQGSPNAAAARYSDLWRYNPTTNMWTWLKGPNVPSQNGVYGTRGVAAAINNPGGRSPGIAWTDINGKFWMFGGTGMPAVGAADRLNDVWKYDPVTNDWTWMLGSNAGMAPSVYGTQGIAAPGNTPGGRWNLIAGWTDAQGNFWLFGGYGYGTGSTLDFTNDLWKLVPACPGPITISVVPNNPTICYGDSVTLTVSGAYKYTWSPSASLNRDTGAIVKAGPIANTTYTVIGVDIHSCRDTITTTVSIFPRTIATNTALEPVTFCEGDSVRLQAAPTGFSFAYQWQKDSSNIAGGTGITYTAKTSGQYAVVVTDANGCKDTASPIAVAVQPTPVVDLGADKLVCNTDLPLVLKSPQPVASQYIWSTGLTIDSIEVVQSDTYWLEITSNGCVSSDTVKVTVIMAPVVDAGRDSIICEATPLKIGTFIPDAIYKWSNDSTTPFIHVNSTADYILTVTLGPCVVRDTVSITAMPNPYIDLGIDTDICPKQAIILNAGNPGGTYIWSTGAVTATETVTQAGKYWVQVTSQYKCVGSDTVLFKYYAAPTVLLGVDTNVCEETPLILAPIYAINEDSLIWSNGQVASQIEVTKGDVYMVTAINKCGRDTAAINIQQVYCDIWLPNAFTPDGDGRNDILRVLGNISRLQDFSFNIYNRWGQLVFTTTDKFTGWNGKQKNVPCNMDTYMYMIQYSRDGEPVSMKGNVILIR